MTTTEHAAAAAGARVLSAAGTLLADSRTESDPGVKDKMTGRFSSVLLFGGCIRLCKIQRGVFSCFSNDEFYSLQIWEVRIFPAEASWSGQIKRYN